jgi:membrane-associated protein
MIPLLLASVTSWLLHPDLHPLVNRGAPVFLLVIMAVVFAESGLLVGFFLPGDSLLFSAGLVVATNGGKPNIALLLLCCFVAAALGDQVGYIFGARIGPALFDRPDSRLFKQENVTRSHAFFERHGPKALILARFVPVVRTFTPILAGVGQMRYRTFVTFNLIGAAAWSALATLLGYTLGSTVPSVEKYLTPVLVVVVALSLLPIGIELLRARKQAERAGRTERAEAAEKASEPTH